MEYNLEQDITFIVEEKPFKISKNKIPKDSHLDHLVSLTENKNEIEITSLTKEAFEYIFNYLNFGTLPNIDFLFGFEYMLIPQSYELFCILEEDMRKNMYSLNNNKKYEEKYYGLRCINEEFWTLFEPKIPKGDDFLFLSYKLVKNPWNIVKQKLELFEKLISIKEVFIAGGAVFSCLFDVPINDIDIFLYGCNEEEANNKINEIKNVLLEHYSGEYSDGHTRCVRTKNALTFTNIFFEKSGYIDIQIILRLYKTPSEIIHGFDVDSCCIGYDKNIWITERALFSLENGYNIVNFDRLSPSYEYRLSKYGSRGIAVKIPNFSIEKIKVENLYDYSKKNEPSKYYDSNSNYKHLLKKKGLDILIYFDHRSKKYFNMKKMGIERRTKEILKKLDKEHSDYSTIPYNYNTGGVLIGNVLYGLASTKNKYPEFSKKYMPLIEKYFQIVKKGRYIYSGGSDDYCDLESDEKEIFIWEENVGYLKLSNFFMVKKITYISSFFKDFDILINIPEDIYEALSIVRPFDFPRKLEWKITNPGEQMTNTFHQIVLEDNSEWYKGEFY